MDQSDVIALGARIIVCVGESFTSPKAQKVLEAFEDFSKYMTAVMDTNMGGQVSPQGSPLSSDRMIQPAPCPRTRSMIDKCEQPSSATKIPGQGPDGNF